MNQDSIEWSYHFLTSHGYQLKDSVPETVQDTPWSYVAKFSSSDGDFYLKQTPKDIALEADIICLLSDKFQIHVPELIAHNADLHCFLMKDAGKSLRSILKQKFNIDLFCKAINQFTAMQIAVADHVDMFLEIGVPDWRLDKLPHLYLQLLSQKEMLIKDGLSEDEIAQLQILLPKVTSLCVELSKHSIKQSIVQPDFNDNNTLIDEKTQTITMIDLGEIAISHPFFSLINCLEQAKKHHPLSEDSDAYKELLQAALNHYLSFEPANSLMAALAKASILMPIYSALCDYRLISACDQSRFTDEFRRHGRPGVSLKEFLKNN